MSMNSYLNKVWYHSLHIIVLVVIALALGLIVGGIIISRNMPAVKAFDNYVFTLINTQWQSDVIDYLVIPFNFPIIPFGGPVPTFLYVMVFGLLAYVWFRNRTEVVWVVATIAIGLFLALSITALVWQFVQGPRPFLVLPSTVTEFARNIWYSLPSYPSGHARDTALLATIISAYIPQITWLMVVLTLFVGLSRIYVGAHFLTDVIAGWVLGYGSARIALRIVREIRRLRKHNDI